MTRLKIDLHNGLLEVEGEESFVKGIFNEYKNALTTHRPNISHHTVAPLDTKDSGSLSSKKNLVQTRPKTKNKSSFSLIKDLDLSGGGNIERLKDFYTKKSPSSGLEKNAVFVYYLQKIANIDRISVDYIFTCYKEVNEKVPVALKQSLADTASKKAWIDTSSMDNIKTTIRGENLVEHDLPSKKEVISTNE